MRNFMESNLKNLKKDVKSFAKKIVKIAKTDEKVRDLYKGTKIFFSPVVKNPKFMFLGINPGVSPAAKENKFKEAYIKIEESDKIILKSHEYQTNLITREAGGEKININMLKYY